MNQSPAGEGARGPALSDPGQITGLSFLPLVTMGVSPFALHVIAGRSPRIETRGDDLARRLTRPSDPIIGAMEGLADLHLSPRDLRVSRELLPHPHRPMGRRVARARTRAHVAGLTVSDPFR